MFHCGTGVREELCTSRRLWGMNTLFRFTVPKQTLEYKLLER